jgi:hypothetical protein
MKFGTKGMRRPAPPDRSTSGGTLIPCFWTR